MSIIELSSCENTGGRWVRSEVGGCCRQSGKSCSVCSVFRVRDVSCEALGQSRGVSWIRFLLLLLFRAVAVALSVPVISFSFSHFSIFHLSSFSSPLSLRYFDVDILAQAILAQAGKVVRVFFERVTHVTWVIVPLAERKRGIHGRDDAGSSQLDEPWMYSGDTSRLASGSAGHGSC